MSVTNAYKDLEALFEELLGEPVRRAARQSFQREVQEILFKEGLEKKLRTDIPPLEVPILHKKIRVPFGYQNGRFNLLAPITFEAKDSDQSLTTACKFAVEGQSLNETTHPEFGPLRFCVVGKFRGKDQETPGRVEELLDHYGVKLYRADHISTLIDEIRRTGKDVVQS